MEIATAVGTEISLSALSSVINKLATYLGGDVTPEEMDHLKLFLLSEILVFIEEGKSNDLIQSRPLLEKLQESALQVDDLLDLYEYNQIKKQVSSSSTNFIKKLIPILKRKLACILPKSSLRINLEQLLTFVDQVEKKYPFIKLTKTKDRRKQEKHKSPEATTSTLSSPYFGRHKQYESIVKILLAESQADSDRRINEVPVIAITGKGGSGKSLTAQLICKDKRITNYFDELPMWVHVTTDFDVEKLTKKIAESANNEECPQFTNLDVLQSLLKDSVKKRRKFLLVLDDVWCENKNKWDLLVGPLNEAGWAGSKVIITTREERVAYLLAGKKNVISLDELEAEDCWSILKYYVFSNSKHVIEDPELVNVGNQIISKARYSPLALKVVGSSLRDLTNVDEWEKILKRDILGETMDLLSFSFQRLPSHLQRCFAYCSLFPKGYIYEEKLLVSLWIAQGYIENTNDEWTLEEKGSMYIADLLSYSFFEKDSGDEMVIHDLLHDLAERASGNLCHKIEHYDSLMKIPENCIHLSMYRNVDFGSIEISNISKLRDLHSLIILDDASCTNIFKDNTDIFQILSKLRVLYVKSDRDKEVLSNLHVDQLKHLRYLHLNHDKRIPESLTKLYHLQFLNLIVGSNITEFSDGHRCLITNILPQGFGNLINLRTIQILYNNYEVDYLKCNSEVINIEKLKSLQNVPVFYPEKDNVNGMVPLKDLSLCGLLKVCDLENVKSKNDAEKAMLKQKKNLNELILQWGSNPSSGSNDLETCEEVLKGLEPHQNLKSLTIIRYQGVKLANWMERKSWPLRLQSLTLMCCKRIRVINFLPPGLKEVRIECCKELMQFPPFDSTLHKLQLIDCPMLMQLPPFSRALKYLQLINCPALRLQSMPNNSPCIEHLEVKECPMLMTGEPSLLVEKVAERDTIYRFSQVEEVITDEPLLILVLVQQQAFSSIKRLILRCTEAKPFPPALEDHFPKFTSLCYLELNGFKTLPNLGKLSSLEELDIFNCTVVELLPNLPISLNWIRTVGCPKLEVNYNKDDGPLYDTISHIPDVSI